MNRRQSYKENYSVEKKLVTQNFLLKYISDTKRLRQILQYSNLKNEMSCPLHLIKIRTYIN